MLKDWVIVGREVVVISEGMVDKMVTDSTSMCFSVDSFVTSIFGDSIDGATVVEMLAVVISADVVVVLVLVTVVGAAWMVVVVVVVVVVMVVVVDGDDVSSVVVVCEIVSRCDVWHEKRG